MAKNTLGILLISFLLVLLSGSIFLNFRLYHRAKQYYLEVNETRLDPVGLNKYPDPVQPGTPHQIRVVIFGDSRAASWKLANFNQYEFINRGIGSQTSTQTLKRFDAHVFPLKPDVIIIQVGINDLKTIALFPDRKEAILENCRHNIQKIVEASQKLGAIVILTTIFPAGKVPLERQVFWSNEINQAIADTNDYIKQLAGENIIVFDTFSLLADDQGLMLPEYRLDQLHFTQSAYNLLNQELITRLETLKF